MRHAFIALVLATSSLAAAGSAHAAGCAGPAGGGDWAMRSGNLTGARSQPAEDQLGATQAANLAPRWIAAAGGVSGTPIEAEGCVYFVDGGAVTKLNADTGDLVWRSAGIGAGASLAYADGLVFANVTWPSGGVGLTALNASDGSLAWSTFTDNQYDVTVNGSPVAFNGMVLTGIAAGGQEIENGPQRTAMRGAYVLLDEHTGTLLHKGYVIPDSYFAAGYAGGGLWSTPAVDDAAGYAYFGTGNPYSAREYARTNSIIKVDVDPARATFGEIVASYKGLSDLYLSNLNYKPTCEQTNTIVPCEPLDVDFGGSPNLWKDSLGREMVGDLQKAGVYHAVDATTMGGMWTATVSYPATFGNAGTAAVDGARVYVTPEAGAMFGIDAGTGLASWVTPTGGNGWATVNSVANGVVYEADNGMLRAIDAATGVPVIVRALSQDTGSASASGLDAGVAIARHTVYVNAGNALIAYRAA